MGYKQVQIAFKGGEMIRVAIAILAGFALGGCATQGTSTANYTPSNQLSVTNERAIARPQSVVWDELVRELSKSFYVINNIERESRIINVSFNSNSASDYVDCGRTRRTYTQGDNTETVEYAVADPATFKVAGSQQPHPAMLSYAIVRREPSLEGRSNIYVAPEAGDSGKTIVSVNTRYILSVRTRAEGIVQHANGNILNRQSRDDSSSFIFNTNKPSTTVTGGVAVVCAGTGRLERDILNMVR